MPASKYSPEFKEHVVAEVLEGSRPIAEVAKSYNLEPQTVDQLGEDMAETASRPRYGRSIVGSGGGD